MMTEIVKKNIISSKYVRTIDWIISTGKRNRVFFLHFFTGQFLLQVFNLLNGFFLLRWLSIDEQAKFSIAFGIQSLIVTLSDLGFTGSIIALVGDRIHDKKVIGSYTQSAKRLRNYLFFIGCGIAFTLLPFIVKKQAWNYLELTLLLIPVLLSVFWQADISLYDSTLIMHKRMKELYTPQVGISALKFLTNFLLYATNIISAFSTLVLNSFAFFINGKIFKKKASPFVTLSKEKYANELKEMINYLKPLFPSLIFNALYSQIQIFVISFFGKTSNIAEVAALGKLAQIFVFLSSINGAIIAPYIAKTSFKQLGKKYFIILSITFFVALGIAFSSYLFPEIYLFLLGPKYYYLKSELNLMVINACLSYIGSVMWTIHSARKWIFWWSTWLYIICVTTCQIIGMLIFDVSTTHGVLAISTLTLACMFLVHAQAAFTGFYNQKLGKV